MDEAHAARVSLQQLKLTKYTAPDIQSWAS